MLESILKCPVCDSKLFFEKKVCKCMKNHSFDISKENYVNLVLANQKHSANPGDDIQMMRARYAFLSKDYYKPLSDSINQCVMDFLQPERKLCCILDIGCGVGYYINELKKNLDKLKNKTQFYGLDISKESIKRAASIYKEINFIVGNAYKLPFISNSVDFILNVFSPISQEEVTRVLKKNGIVISVRPGEKHLFEMKKMIYDSACYHNEDTNIITNMFLLKDFKISSTITVDKNDLETLYKMTPYFWNKPSLNYNSSSDLYNITTDFIIRIYQNL